MSEEIVHSDVVHAGETEIVHRTDEERREYRRKWMQKKRAEDRMAVESVKLREGGLDASECPVLVVPNPELPLTKTDRKFEEKNPGYWIYVGEVKERECWGCGESFETRLELNKFCGPKCKEKWLSDAFGKLKGVK